MFSGPIRRCRKLWPAILLTVSIFAVAIWRRSYVLSNGPGAFQKGSRNQREYTDSRGMKVIVGYYVGHSKIPNATGDMLDTNNFNPMPDAGKDGKPVSIQPKDLLKMQQLFQINRFNLMASDMIPLNRSLKDVRRKK